MTQASLQTIIAVPAVDSWAYPITVGVGIIPSLVETIKTNLEKKLCSSVLVVFDPVLSDHSSLKPLKVFPSQALPASGEAVKKFTNLELILKGFAEQKLDRKSVVVAVGGGATGDAVSLAASLYMRGISVIQVPTTILSMVDSSIGGKTAVNLGVVKNLVGTFCHPASVHIDLEFLSTLSDREYRSGFAEIIKHAIIDDVSIIEDLHRCTVPNFSRTDPALADLVIKQLMVKKRIVERDPFEKNDRKKLNFGHSAGHAFESCSHQTTTPLLHGEAVMLGMLFEAQLAQLEKPSANEVVQMVESLGKLLGFDLTFPTYPLEEFMNALSLDKKNRGSDLRFALSYQVGSCEIDRIVSQESIKKLFHAHLNRDKFAPLNRDSHR